MTDPSASISGTVWIPAMFVQVQWTWLAMPLSLYVFVGILLFPTIAESLQSGVEIWKSTPIAPLLYGLPDGEEQNRMPAEISGKAVESATDGVRAKLVADRGGVLHMLPGCWLFLAMLDKTGILICDTWMHHIVTGITLVTSGPISLVIALPSTFYTLLNKF